jgi:hypothetical protein
VERLRRIFSPERPATKSAPVASLKVVGKEDLLEAPLSAQNEKGHRGVLLENLT